MAGGKPTVLVLWGDYFDEYAATAFVCELRSAGVRVRLVGIDRRYARGRHGLVLGSDMSLEQALTLPSPIAYVVLPCQQGQWLQLQRHWQVQKWLERLAAAGAMLVVRETVMEEMNVPATAGQAANPALPLSSLHSWSGETEAALYARELANLLQCC